MKSSSYKLIRKLKGVLKINITLNKPGVVFQGLTSPRVKITYGDNNINEIIKSLIAFDIEKMNTYNVDTNIICIGDNNGKS